MCPLPGRLDRSAGAAPTPLARPDPVAGAAPGQELVYETIQKLWSARARRRYRTDFDAVEAFCLFVGYPRSGHSLVGAMLNAHRDAVISHELDAPRLLLEGRGRDVVYSRILGRAAWFNLRGNRSNYRYQIPGQWQGRFETLRVIGDKGGGWAAQWLREHPDLLRRTRATVGVPLRLIHIVRNPFDNIAAISLWHGMSLDDSIDFFFSHCEATGGLAAAGAVETAGGPETAGALDAGDDTRTLTVRHEDFIRAPGPTLATVCDFLGLEPEADYLDACAGIVFDRPSRSRRRVSWSPDLVREVERRMRPYPFFDGYAFEIEGEAEAADATGGAGSRAPSAGPSPPAGPAIAPLRERISAFLHPRARAGPGRRDT